MNACMCSTNNKNEEPVLFICRRESGKKKFGLWQAENLTEKRTVMLLSNVSPPLTVATEDNAMQFLTHEHYSGTGKSKSVYQKYG